MSPQDVIVDDVTFRKARVVNHIKHQDLRSGEPTIDLSISGLPDAFALLYVHGSQPKVRQVSGHHVLLFAPIAQDEMLSSRSIQHEHVPQFKNLNKSA